MGGFNHIHRYKEYTIKILPVTENKNPMACCGIIKLKNNQSFKNEEAPLTDKRKAFEEKLEAQLKEWNAQIALLKAKAENAKADAKIEYQRTIETLQHKRDKAGSKLHELKAAGDGAWVDLKTGAEKAWTEVKAAFHDAAAKFK